MSDLYLLGGPNGVGKSTHSEQLAKIHKISIIDGDKIAKELSQHTKSPLFIVENVIQNRIKDHINNKVSFVIESNLDINSAYSHANLAKKNGYNVHLIYMGVDDQSILNKRIEDRAKLGLHFISPPQVKSKYAAALSGLPNKIHTFNTVNFLDNSSKRPIQIFYLENNMVIYKVKSMPKWAKKVFDRYIQLEKYKSKLP
tara:strand:- start:267 stop:863 length:597 start_codon:yes stop_codon:yes gene_type:complete